MRVRNTNLIMFGVSVIALAIILLVAPGVFASVSLADAHSVCSSTLGQLGQAFSQRIAADCSNVGVGYAVDLIAGVAGLVLVGFGIYGKPAQLPPPPPPPPPGLPPGGYFGGSL